MKALSGTMFKLADKRGEYLGVLIVPAWVAKALAGSDEYQTVAVQQHVPLTNPFSHPNEIDANATTGVFNLASSYDLAGGVVLLGIDVGAISKQPGFAFLPAASYLARVSPAPEHVGT